MNASDIAQARLAHQQISSSAQQTPSEVVAHLGALQAQDYRSVLWAVGLRLPGSSEAEIEQAISERSLVRSWPLRGTLHLVAAADIGWMLGLLTPHIIAGSARRRQQLELDDATLLRSRELIVQTLQGGRQLTREAVMALLEDAHISTRGQRGYHILWQLALRGVICFGVREGKQQTFALLDEWVPRARRLARDEALAELALRYFSGHGPATLQDFVWWSGLKAPDARAGLEFAAPQLTQDTFGGQPHWMPQAGPTRRPQPPRAFLLPGFDEYMLGYRARDAVLDARHAQKIVPGSNGVFRPILVIDGRIVGTWKATQKKNRIVIALDPFVPFSTGEEQAVAAAAEQYGRYVGVAAEIA